MSVASIEHRNRRTGLIALALALGMLGLGYAAVPLYRIFCQVTGLDGTTQRATVAEAALVPISTRAMSIRFDANVEKTLPWTFYPKQRTDRVAIGARDMAIFVARNDSDHPITGTASFNVSPTQAGKYFNKIQCFCFTEQTLQPGQALDMPVLYYVDPAILDDPDTRDFGQITLSYTFFESKKSQDPAG